MAQVFISHTEKDSVAVTEIVTILEHSGFQTWFFERDTLPGTSYLIQIQNAIEKCDAFVLVASSYSVTSDQVTKEVVAAFERRKPIFPLLLDLTPTQLKELQPEWRHALGGTAFICSEGQGVAACVSRVVDGLRSRGISPKLGRLAVRSSSNKPSNVSHQVERVLAARRDLDGERRQVTVLSAEVADFASTDGEMDLESSHELATDCLNLMTEEIGRYDGSVTQLLSHGVVALFGAPIVREDAPRRAMHASLGIKTRLEEYAKGLRQKGVEFTFRAGMNTGPVIMCRVEGERAVEFAAVGDTINDARRMMNGAKPWTVQASESTYRLTVGFFSFQRAGETKMSGSRNPVHAYLVNGLGEAKTRIGVSRTRGLTPFVGRGMELDLLMEKYESAKKGRGQVVSIVGEPGIGKSRLLLQLRDRLCLEEYRYLEGGCHHYGEPAPFLPLLRILRSYFAVEEGEPSSSARSKLQDGIRRLDPRMCAVALPPLLDILSLNVDDSEYLKLDPARRKLRIFEAARNLLLLESRKHPVVIAIEDLHWIDRPSEEFLNFLISSVAHSGVLVLLLYRPEYRNTNVNGTYYSQIFLDAFSPDASSEMINAIFREGKASVELREMIRTKAVGNPLFLEEFVRSLVDQGAIQRDDGHYILRCSPSDIQIPESVQGIIDARISRLPESQRQTLQMASVIGRSFSLSVLQNVIPGSDDLGPQLVDLQAGDFIYETAILPEPEFVFKHALTQEVAYSSLLLKRREELHERTGTAIETLFSGRLEEFYEILAHHYSSGKNRDKAFHYLRLSSLKAGSRNSMTDSIRFGRDAISVLNGMPRTDENQRRSIEMRLMLSGPLAATGFGGNGLQLMEEGAELAERLGDTKSLVNFWGSIAVAKSGRGDGEIAAEFAEKAFKAANATKDASQIATSCFELCLVASNNDDQLRIAEVVPEVLSTLRTEHLEERVDIGKYYNYNLYSVLQSYYGASLGYAGDFENGLQQCEEALKLAEKIGNLYSLGLVELLNGVAYMTRGDGELAIQHIQRCIKTCEESELAVLPWIAETILGLAYLTKGDLKEARRQFESRIETWRRTDYSYMMSMNQFGLGALSLESRDPASAKAYFEESLRLARKHREAAGEGMSMVGIGVVKALMDRSHYSEAEDLALAGIKVLEGLHQRPNLAKAYLLLGEMYIGSGHCQKGIESIGIARRWFQEMGMEGYAAKANAALQDLETKRQDRPIIR